MHSCFYLYIKYRIIFLNLLRYVSDSHWLITTNHTLNHVCACVCLYIYQPVITCLIICNIYLCCGEVYVSNTLPGFRSVLSLSIKAFARLPNTPPPIIISNKLSDCSYSYVCPAVLWTGQKPGTDRHERLIKRSLLQSPMSIKYRRFTRQL